jgi:transposase
MYKDLRNQDVVKERQAMLAEDHRSDELRRDYLINSKYHEWEISHPDASIKEKTKQRKKMEQKPTQTLSSIPRSGSVVLPWRESWFQYLRNRVVTHPEKIDIKNNTTTNQHWSRHINKHVRAFAVDDFAKGLKTSFCLQKGGHVSKRRVHFRAKKRMVQYCLKLPKESVQILSSYQISVCPTSMKQWIKSQGVDCNQATGTIHLGRRQRNQKTTQQKRNQIRNHWRNPQKPNYFKYTPAITFDRRTQKWHLVVPFDTPEQQRPCSAKEPESVVALDPGERTFHTYYTSDGEYGKAGNGSVGRLRSLAKLTQTIQSEIDHSKTCLTRGKPPPTYYRKGMKGPRKVNHRRRKHLRRKLLRLNARIRELTKDVHCKLTEFLVDRYDVIIRPPFETKDFLMSSACHAITKRGLNLWSHYKFRCRLQAKAHAEGVTLIEPSEAYTTRTCGLCGHVNPNVGNSHTFRCVSKQCYGNTHAIDRDVHAARNILIKTWCDPTFTN